MTNGSDEQAVAEILACEDARALALAANDWDALGEILGDDYEYTHSTGRTETKPVWLTGMKKRSRSVERGELTVRLYGDAAVVHGPSQYRYTEPFDGDSHYGVVIDALQVWARRDGTWKLVASHNVKIPDRPRI